MFKILFLGDVVGRPGRKVVKDHLRELQQEFAPDLTIVNGENSAGGIGIDAACADEIFTAGAHLITTGNHIWGRKEFIPYLEKNRARVIRPVNYAPGAPGEGYCTWTSPSGVKVGVLNAMGRIFMGELLDCPFRGVDAALEKLSDCALVFLDFHAEATSEKIAMARYLDGRVAVQVGTHTHVQTADEQILPNGLAYITDVGMCGPYGGVIGMGHEAVIQKFISGRPSRFDVADGEVVLNGVIVECDEVAGKALSISRINRRYG
ncbi:MAG: TIGR00282 family metallophosphoesterase [Bdellovibrionota bacterium]